MDKQLIFDLLEYPVTPAGDGDLVVFDSAQSLRRVGLRGTPGHVVDVSRDQGRSPWLVSDQEVFLLDGRHRELAFSTEQFGRTLGGAGCYPTLLGEVSQSHRPAIFALNTMRGAWILEAADGNVQFVSREPIPALLFSFWEQDGTLFFAGSSTRAEQAEAGSGETVYSAGTPLIVSVKDRELRSIALNELVPLDDWSKRLPNELQREPRFAKRLVPEICVAGEWHSTTRLVVATTGLHDPFDALDVRGRYPAATEIFGLIFAVAESRTLAQVAPYYSSVASMRTEAGHSLYIGRNRGHGPEVGALQKIDLCGDLSESTPITVKGLDASLTCESFCPNFHPRVGYFGTLRAGTGDRRSVAHFLHSEDALNWTVVGDQDSLKVTDPS